MKEKLLLAIVITCSLGYVQELSFPTVSSPKTPPMEFSPEFSPKHIASLWGVDR